MARERKGYRMTAHSKMTAARTSLVLENPFFGSLALSLPPKEDSTCDTAWTDGRNIGYNPTFIDSLTHEQVTALVAHEVMHCACGHPWRRDGRNQKSWNVACDKAINGELRTSFKLPNGALYPDAGEEGKSAEWYYARIQEDDEGNGTGQGQGNNPQGQGQGPSKPDPLGEVRDAPTGVDADGEPAPTEQEWKQNAASAMQQAKMCGKMGSGLARTVQNALKARIDIRSLLLRFFSERSTGDYSWTRPSNRYLASGLYLPVLESRALGEIAILVDTSGSVSSVALGYARGILEQVLDEVSPAGVTLYFVDTKIHGTHRMEQGEPLTWEPKGGGGTSFESFFQTVENGEIQPVCVIGISDLEASFGDMIPTVPVLWLTDSQYGTAPFGEVVYVDR